VTIPHLSATATRITLDTTCRRHILSGGQLWRLFLDMGEPSNRLVRCQGTGSWTHGKLICPDGAGFTDRFHRLSYLGRLEGFCRFKVQDYENGDTQRGAEVKLSAPTAGTDDRTDDCASGADNVAVPAKVQVSTFSNDR
jgi:hypothetical protein